MGVKADIGWTRLDEDGGKRCVYVERFGGKWKFFHRSKRRGRDIEWERVEEPPLVDWLELVDALERGYVRRRYQLEDIAAVRKTIRERFPDHRFEE